MTNENLNEPEPPQAKTHLLNWRPVLVYFSLATMVGIGIVLYFSFSAIVRNELEQRLGHVLAVSSSLVDQTQHDSLQNPRGSDYAPLHRVERQAQLHCRNGRRHSVCIYGPARR